jgi:hypothetical protein
MLHDLDCDDRTPPRPELPAAECVSKNLRVLVIVGQTHGLKSNYSNFFLTTSSQSDQKKLQKQKKPADIQGVVGGRWCFVAAVFFFGCSSLLPHYY